jgi:hypothetical protein
MRLTDLNGCYLSNYLSDRATDGKCTIVRNVIYNCGSTKRHFVQSRETVIISISIALFNPTGKLKDIRRIPMMSQNQLATHEELVSEAIKYTFMNSMDFEDGMRLYVI